MKLITENQLLQIVGARQGSRHHEQIKALIGPLNRTMRKYKINTPLRVAHFISQLAHESMRFRRTVEVWPNPRLDARGVARNGNRWQIRYERMRGSLGNTRPGDGYRFRGRGLIQLTGRFNYTAYGKALGRDLVTGNKMDAVARLPLAVDVAGWFWSTRRQNLNVLADGDNFIRITRAINGGLNGREDRRRLLIRAKRILAVSGPQTDRRKQYTVRQGDSLSRIAATYGLTLARVIEANPEIKGPKYTIHPGQKIKLPGRS